MNLKFKIEQVAIVPLNAEKAMTFLSKIGAQEWAKDHVCARGEVFGAPGSNEADLAFNYDILEGAKEFEVLDYTAGPNWVDVRTNNNGRSIVSHLGMHCTEDELDAWKKFMAEEGVNVAQEVFTTSHTNPVIAGKRLYHYCIFDTRDILGVDLKFIVRRDCEV